MVLGSLHCGKVSPDSSDTLIIMVHLGTKITLPFQKQTALSKRKEKIRPMTGNYNRFIIFVIELRISFLTETACERERRNVMPVSYLKKRHTGSRFWHFKPKTSIEPIEKLYNHEQVHHFPVYVRLPLLDSL